MTSSTFIQLVRKWLPRSQKQITVELTPWARKRCSAKNTWSSGTYLIFFSGLLLFCFIIFGRNVFFIICFTVRLSLALPTDQYLCFSSSPRPILQNQLTFFLFKSLLFEWKHVVHWSKYWSAISRPEDSIKMEYKDCLLCWAIFCHYFFVYQFLSVHLLPFTFTF